MQIYAKKHIFAYNSVKNAYRALIFSLIIPYVNSNNYM